MAFEEYHKEFDKWNGRKKAVNNYSRQVFCNQREVWWVYLGVNVGFEQDGKNEDYVRPVLILRTFNKNIFLSVPLSTKRKPGNRFYIEFTHHGQTIAAVISQVRLLDAKRLKRKMYRLDEKQFEVIQSAVVGMIKGGESGR